VCSSCFGRTAQELPDDNYQDNSREAGEKTKQQRKEIHRGTDDLARSSYGAR
jgi:hypothetical protein